jgi:hypothetical protein
MRTRFCNICGYGRIDLDYALHSIASQVTLFASASIEIDKFAIFEVPIPKELKDVEGEKFIDVALAFDPPVRRRRADYLGVSMSFDLIRGKKLSEVIDAYRAAESQETPDRAISGSSRISFFPTTRCKQEGFARNASTLQKGTFSFKRSTKDYGESYWLVVRAQREWLPDAFTHQDFAVAVNVRAATDKLYGLIQSRINVRLLQREQQRQRQRT